MVMKAEYSPENMITYMYWMVRFLTPSVSIITLLTPVHLVSFSVKPLRHVKLMLLSHSEERNLRQTVLDITWQPVHP